MSIENPANFNGSARRRAAVDGTPPHEEALAEEPLSFEEALHELEEVVASLESGNVPLEQAIAQLQRGIALAEQCDATLAHAEATLEQLISTPEGELATERIAYEDEDTIEDA